MKTDQKKQAEQLFFQTDLNKSEIANMLGISRSTLHSWVRENNWERLKQASAHMPVMLTELSYYAMHQLLESVLSENRIMKPITKQEADTLHKMTLTINRLGKRTSLNESMELIAFFMEDVAAKDPEAAKTIKPFIQSFIQSRAAVQPHHFTPAKFGDMGYIPVPTPSDKDLEEAQLDLADIMAWSSEQPIQPASDSNELSNITEQQEPIQHEIHDNAGVIARNEATSRNMTHCDEASNLIPHRNTGGSSQQPKLNRKQRRALDRQNKFKQAA
jgi:transposase-like protein